MSWLKRMRNVGLHGPLPKNAEFVYTRASWISKADQCRLYLINTTGDVISYVTYKWVLLALAVSVGPIAVISIIAPWGPNWRLASGAALVCSMLAAGAYHFHRKDQAALRAWNTGEGGPYFDRERGLLVFPNGSSERQYRFDELEAYVARHPTSGGVVLHYLTLFVIDPATGERGEEVALPINPELEGTPLLQAWATICRFMDRDGPLPLGPQFWHLHVQQRYPNRYRERRAQERYFDEVVARWCFEQRMAGVTVPDLGVPDRLDPASPACEYPEHRECLEQAQLEYRARLEKARVALGLA